MTQTCVRCPRLTSSQIGRCANVATAEHTSLATVISVWLDERDRNHANNHSGCATVAPTPASDVPPSSLPRLVGVGTGAAPDVMGSTATGAAPKPHAAT